MKSKMGTKLNLRMPFICVHLNRFDLHECHIPWPLNVVIFAGGISRLVIKIFRVVAIVSILTKMPAYLYHDELSALGTHV